MRGVLLRGVPVSVMMMLAAALALTAPDVSAGVYRFCAGLPLLCGGFSAGWYAGRRNRRHGLLGGIPAGCILTALWYAGIRLIGGHPGLPVILPAVCLLAMCGGAAGVNRQEPDAKRRPHRRIRLREALALRLRLLHRPEKQPKA